MGRFRTTHTHFSPELSRGRVGRFLPPSVGPAHFYSPGIEEEGGTISTTIRGVKKLLEDLIACEKRPSADDDKAMGRLEWRKKAGNLLQKYPPKLIKACHAAKVAYDKVEEVLTKWMMKGSGKVGVFKPSGKGRVGVLDVRQWKGDHSFWFVGGWRSSGYHHRSCLVEGTSCEDGRR